MQLAQRSKFSATLKCSLNLPGNNESFETTVASGFKQCDVSLIRAVTGGRKESISWRAVSEPQLASAGEPNAQGDVAL
jgi:hypothetical protein